jgi:hypothetical protein
MAKPLGSLSVHPEGYMCSLAAGNPGAAKANCTKTIHSNKKELAGNMANSLFYGAPRGI